LKALFGLTSCYLTAAARSVRFTCRAISSVSKMAISIVSQPRAIVDTTVRLVERQSLEREAKNDPAMVRSLLTMTTDNLQHVENHLLLLGRQTAQERVGAFLLEMNGRQTSADVIALPMSRLDIADYLGLTIETVSRVLSKFQRKGYLRFSDQRQRQFVVLNAAGLALARAHR
jgi:CRP/FNR family transcriptional regulator, nitrogen fixation regulation protein